MAVYKRDSKGHIIPPGDKRKGTWWYDFQYEGKRYKKSLRGITSEKDAEKIERKVRVSVYEGTYERQRRDITFDHFTREFFLVSKKNDKRFSSYELYASFAEIFCQYFKGRLLREITTADIEAFRQHRHATLTPSGKERSRSTINREMAQLSSIFGYAVQLQKIESNPCRRLKSYVVDNRRTRVLQKNEEEQLLEALVGKYYCYKPVVILALQTGMRLAEIVNLKWENVEFAQSTTEDFGKITLLANATKGKKQREVPLNSVSRQLLIDLRGDVEKASGRIFVGSRFIKQTVLKAISLLCDEIGLPDVTLHTMRHTVGTRLNASGATAFDIMKLLGHTSLRMTEIYVKPQEESLRKAINRLA